jgi:hypothetical protein
MMAALPGAAFFVSGACSRLSSVVSVSHGTVRLSQKSRRSAGSFVAQCGMTDVRETREERLPDPILDRDSDGQAVRSAATSSPPFASRQRVSANCR